VTNGSLRIPISVFSRPGSSHNIEIAALLPVFNGERHLEKCLRSLGKAVDAVIALDDGSTDRTPEILRDYNIVKKIATFPPKSIEDWDEAWTRRTLYDLVNAMRPLWILCFDADEEIEDSFGLFRKSLLGQPADIKGFVFPRVGIYKGKITRPIYLHRMYRYGHGYSFHTKRIHCRAIPLEIYLEELRIVNIRIFHHSVSPRDKRARYERYRRVDPSCKYQRSYENLLRLRARYSIAPLGEFLQLTPVHEDGFQQLLVGKRFFERAAPEAISIEGERIQSAFKGLCFALNIFNRLRLKTFIVVNKEGDQYRAQYSYDERISHLLTDHEAWFIESYWTRKDLEDMLAQFAFAFGIEFPRSLDALWHIMRVLHSKEILLLRGNTSLPKQIVDVDF